MPLCPPTSPTRAGCESSTPLIGGVCAWYTTRSLDIYSRGMALEQAAIIAYVAETCAGTSVVTGTEGIAAGDTFFIYDPDRNLPDNQQLPFATIVTKDYGDFDKAS